MMSNQDLIDEILDKMDNLNKQLKDPVAKYIYHDAREKLCKLSDQIRKNNYDYYL